MGSWWPQQNVWTIDNGTILRRQIRTNHSISAAVRPVGNYARKCFVRRGSSAHDKIGSGPRICAQHGCRSETLRWNFRLPAKKISNVAQHLVSRWVLHRRNHPNRPSKSWEYYWHSRCQLGIFATIAIRRNSALWRKLIYPIVGVFRVSSLIKKKSTHKLCTSFLKFTGSRTTISFPFT